LEIKMDDVDVLLLLPELPAFKVDKPLEIEICGRSMLDWCVGAVGEHKKVQVKRTDDLVTVVRNNAGRGKYTVVLYADTPLITGSTIEQAVAYVRAVGASVGKMPRGWIFETENIKTEGFISPEDIPNLNTQDFIVAYNYGQLSVIEAIARHRINMKHMGNGVRIIDPATAYIDADVIIGRGTTISPNVQIRRDATIGEDCFISGGVVFEGFNGKSKVKFTVGDKVFFGSNATLTATTALTIGDSAYIAAGSVVTKDVPAHALALERAQLIVKEGFWGMEKKED